MTLPVGLIGTVPGASPRPKIHRIAGLGTSVLTSGGLLTRIATGISPAAITDYSQSGAPVLEVAGTPNHSLYYQITTALAVSPRFQCYILDGDSQAGEYLFGQYAGDANGCVTALGTQLDRLHATGALVFTCYRGVGQYGSTPFGPILRTPSMNCYMARKKWLRFVNVWDIEEQTDDLSHVISGTGGITIGDMFSDTPPTADHYSTIGATMVGDAYLTLLRKYIAPV